MQHCGSAAADCTLCEVAWLRAAGPHPSRFGASFLSSDRVPADFRGGGRRIEGAGAGAPGGGGGGPDGGGEVKPLRDGAVEARRDGVALALEYLADAVAVPTTPVTHQSVTRATLFAAIMAKESCGALQSITQHFNFLQQQFAVFVDMQDNAASSFSKNCFSPLQNHTSPSPSLLSLPPLSSSNPRFATSATMSSSCSVRRCAPGLSASVCLLSHPSIFSPIPVLTQKRTAFLVTAPTRMRTSTCGPCCASRACSRPPIRSPCRPPPPFWPSFALHLPVDSIRDKKQAREWEGSETRMSGMSRKERADAYMAERLAYSSARFCFRLIHRNCTGLLRVV